MDMLYSFVAYNCCQYMQTEYGVAQRSEVEVWLLSSFSTFDFILHLFAQEHSQEEWQEEVVLKLWIVLSSDSIFMVRLSTLQKRNFGG